MAKCTPNIKNRTESDSGLVILALITNFCDVNSIIAQNKGHAIPFLLKNQ